MSGRGCRPGWWRRCQKSWGVRWKRLAQVKNKTQSTPTIPSKTTFLSQNRFPHEGNVCHKSNRRNVFFFQQRKPFLMKADMVCQDRLGTSLREPQQRGALLLGDTFARRGAATGGGAQTVLFAPLLLYKWSFYQDRLGINTGKALQRRVPFSYRRWMRLGKENAIFAPSLY